MAAQAVLIQDGVFIYRRNTPRLVTLGVMVPRAALGVRVPRAHARRVATPSDLINLNQGVRVPWTVSITRPIIVHIE